MNGLLWSQPLQLRGRRSLVDASAHFLPCEVYARGCWSHEYLTGQVSPTRENGGCEHHDFLQWISADMARGTTFGLQLEFWQLGAMRVSYADTTNRKVAMGIQDQTVPTGALKIAALFGQSVPNGGTCQQVTTKPEGARMQLRAKSRGGYPNKNLGRAGRTATSNDQQGSFAFSLGAAVRPTARAQGRLRTARVRAVFADGSLHL